MRCHYEVLGVARDADDGTLKTAYRKAALQWHPDKNQHRLDEADVRFKELQNAYEVLSDKHERAWYDSHREAILRSGETHQAGGDGGVTPGQRPTDEVDPFQYFSTSCYSGYNDGAKGFYTVYNSVFQKLAQEERQAAAQQSDEQGSDSLVTLPAFGTSSLAGSEVAAFYSSWLNYSTLKDFAWADKYNPAAAPNRKVRRLMEDENKKERKSMKRTHNDAVRELVAFVRKRDKRLAAHQAEEAKRRMDREEEDKLRREQERQHRLQRALEVQEADWIQQEAEQQEEEEEEPIPLDDFYCPVCDKSFKSQKALANHERSKQHVRAVEALRAELEEEEQALGGTEAGSVSEDAQSEEGSSQLESDSAQQASAGDAGSDEGHASPPDLTSYTAQTQPSRKKSKKQKKKHRQQQAQMAAAGLGVSSDSEPEAASYQEDIADSRVGTTDGHPPADLDSEDDVLERMMQVAHIHQGAASHEVENEAGLSKDDDDDATSAATVAADNVLLGSGAATPSPHAGLSHEQYKKLKRHKKKHQPANLKTNAAETQFSTSCATCGLDCKSRNKLFAHLKSSGHAALK